MTSPKISVVLPTYSRRHVLPRTIASVLAQDETDFELIIIDDCSLDDTGAYLASLDDPRIRVLRPPSNLQTAGARNLGLEAARADIIAFLDDDDIYFERRLSVPLAVFAREPEVVATLSSAVKVDPRKTYVARMPDLTLPPAAFEWALICDLIGVEGTSITVRRQTALDIGGFSRDVKWIDDREFLIRASRRGSGRLIAEPLWRKQWSHDAQSNQYHRAGLSLLDYVAAQPIFVGRFGKVGSYLATKILVSDLRHLAFGALARDLRDFAHVGLIDGNPLRMWRDHREVRRYRRAMSKHEALATLTEAPAEWRLMPQSQGESLLSTFKALVINKTDAGQTARLADFDERDLMDGDVAVRVEWSTLNYKDGLALTGKSPVVRRFPMIAGIDLAGTVESSSHAGWKAGDKVILNGWGLGETHLGAYAQKARVKGDWLVRLPQGMSAREAMAIGTAGYTAMLAVMALERAGIVSGRGPVIVTGAAGGVGSVAVALLAKLGYSVIASTGRLDEAPYLKRLGASEVIERKELSGPARPIAKERWAGGIDAVGSTTLANVLSMTRYGGAVAACGLAGGMDLPTSVAPFILRGVSLLGIDSVMCPLPARQEAWRRLETDLDRTKIEAMTTEIGLADVVNAGSRIVAGLVRGRIVVNIG